MRALAPWALCAALAIGLALQALQVRSADERALACRDSAAETISLCLDSEAGHARLLTTGLRQLRAGDTDAGFQSLDALLAMTPRGLDPAGSHAGDIAEARAYLEEVGNPFSR